MDIAEIGRAHLRDALAGEMQSCEVTHWLDSAGKPVKIYWRPVTGEEQKRIESVGTKAERDAMTVKIRARKESGVLAFVDVTLDGMMHDFDHDVITTIAFLINTGYGQDFEKEIESAEKE